MKIVHILGLLVLFISANSQEVFDEQNIQVIRKNNIKSQTCWNHAITNNIPVIEGYKNSFSQYDERGNVSEMISYKSTGKVFTMEQYKYDDFDNNIGYIRFDGSQDKITYKKAFKFDETGRKVREVGFDGAANYRNDFKYLNNRLVEIEYYLNDILSQKRIFKYTSATIREINVHSADGTFEFKMTQVLDAKGNVLEDVEYMPKSETVKEKTLFTYNASGMVLSEAKLKGTILQYKKVFEYDSKGNLVSIKQEEQGVPLYELKRYEYNAANKLTKESFRKKASQEFSTKEYTYDEKGLCKEVLCFYASYNYKVLFKYTYE